MQVPVHLLNFFEKNFQPLMEEFLTEANLVEKIEDLMSDRFLKRSIYPHINKLSTNFNRLESKIVSSYWNTSQNPSNLRLAYFLNFMPCNAFRNASIWEELRRMGFCWDITTDTLRVLDFGSGPGSASFGLTLALMHEKFNMKVALLDQDHSNLKLASHWGNYFSRKLGIKIQFQSFQKKIALNQASLLPSAAPMFHIWMMSFVLNELYEQEPDLNTIAQKLIQSWDDHLHQEGIVIIVEPALKEQSRKLLELRKMLLQQFGKNPSYQVLTPCLGHQGCQALSNTSDWCHEEVLFMRPAYLKLMDRITKLNHQSLAFSYLTIIKSKRPRREILQKFKKSDYLARLVSPSHKQQSDWEFFLCTPDGKKRTRMKKINPQPERGDIITNPVLRGENNATRLDSYEDIF
jgi:ribosomal protein RSM22 (predicted rRNA methylase)